MDTVSPAPAARSAAPTAPLLARPLTPGESAHLDRLRAWLRADGTDAHDAAALDARWARLLQTHPADAPAPAGVSAALGIAVGDLLLASVTDAVWMMCPGPDGATPGVLLPDRPHMPVLPVLDAHQRWRVRSPSWTVDYVQRAAAHLMSGRQQVPTPHPAPRSEQPPAAAAPEPTWAPAVVPDAPADAPTPERAAWTPTVVQDTGADEPDPEPAGWSPTFVEDTGSDVGAYDDAIQDPDPEPAAWTPTVVQDTGPDEPDDEPAAWTPTFVEGTGGDDTDLPGTSPAPAAWTPTVVQDTTGTDEPDEPDDEPAAWTPTFVQDTAERFATPDAPVPVVLEEPVVVEEPAVVEEPVAAPQSTVTPGRGLPVTAHQHLTPEDLPHRPSERVQDLALRALELALDRAVADAAGSAPFVLVREGYDVEVLDFPHSDAGLAQARDAARSGGYTAAAVAWTSPADATRPHPRVVVDASAAGRPGIRVAHSYAHDERGGHEVGGPLVVGQSAPVL
ncbi:hypothetical protein J1G42_13425 [Cellulomonas sp. zg-ZUI222]|uniref:hypothetical protein n=1 Tax=Cellulomonas wangleii TaxID=2816956 RepID=UPI001A94025D|nr:hypothetical protein [Cellulomonas wangleii]MBO0921825.1 hypothetical protein [Cellulomonas wangleii]